MRITTHSTAALPTTTQVTPLPPSSPPVSWTEASKPDKPHKPIADARRGAAAP